MATAKKLPSGSWRCQVYSHTEKIWDKTTDAWKIKRIYESFTSDNPTSAGKREAEYMAAEFANSKQNRNITSSMSVKSALKEYRTAKENVLSQTTLRAYISMERNSFADIENLALDKLTTAALQTWVNKLSANHSPKTVRNVYGFLTAVIEMYAPGYSYNITLPQKRKSCPYVPSDGDIQALIDYYKDNDSEMLKAVLLAAFGTLRRSEICALNALDAEGSKIRINKAIVKSVNNTWVVKTTKTVSSTREIDLPQFVMDMLPKQGQLVLLNPSNITDRFAHTFEKLNIRRFRFHDLRHYAASIMHALGVPDVYIMKQGGWSSDATLKNIYRGAIEDYQKLYTERAIGHFEKFDIQHEMQHKKQKAQHSPGSSNAGDGT